MAVTDNARGAGLMMLAMLAFTVNDTMMKTLLEELPFFQAVFLRSLGGTCALLLIWRLQGPVRLAVSRADGRNLLLRGLAEVVTAFLFLSALRSMPLPNATAIIQTLPLALTLAGAVWLGEPVGWRRMLAIAAGFAGVLLIVRPGSEGFGLPSLLALASVGTLVVRELATRRLSPAVPAMAAATGMAAMLTVAAGIGSLFEAWRPLSPALGLRLAVCVMAISAGYVFSVGAMRNGEIAVVSPFRYTALLWSLAFGWLAFGYWPDALSLIGAVVIAGAGLYTFYREMVVAGRGGGAPGSSVDKPGDSPYTPLTRVAGSPRRPRS